LHPDVSSSAIVQSCLRMRVSASVYRTVTGMHLWQLVIIVIICDESNAYLWKNVNVTGG